MNDLVLPLKAQFFHEIKHAERRIVRQWRGMRVTTITHQHFGADPVEVYAIDVSSTAPAPPR